MTYFVITTLAVFIIASVFYQVKSLQGKFLKVDRLHLLPNYSFFAPKPLTNDYRLVYKIIDEQNGGWQEVPMYKLFSFKRIFWNPFKYYNKGIIDTFNFLIKEFDIVEDKNFIMISQSYINILMLISNHIKQKDATIRFAIVTAEGVDQIKIKNVIFASAHQKLS